MSGAAVATAKRRVSIRELARMYNMADNWFYQRSRLEDGLPGMVRIGKHIRIDVDEFDAAVKRGELAVPA